MGEKVDRKFDKDWIALIAAAKKEGLTIMEVRRFLQNPPPKKI